MLESITGSPARALALVQNALEVARFGGLETGDEPAPYTIVGHGRNHRLRRYFAEDPGQGSPVVLVSPLMMSADLWDVSPTTSAVRYLREQGADPWVVDFGRPNKEDGGLERTLSDHVVAISEAVDQVAAERGGDVHLGGYSQGGMLCYQVAAFRQSDRLASVMTFGSPVDLRQMMPAGVPPEVIAGVADLLGAVGTRAAVPGFVTRNAFRMLDPIKATRKQLDFILALHDRDALLPREGQRRFVEGDGWIWFPGPALADFAQQFMAQNRMLMGGIVVAGRTLTLADVRCPVLGFIGDFDEVAPASAIRPLLHAAPNADVWEAHVGAGHLGLVVGSRANAEAWPTVAEWLAWIDEDAPEPSAARRIVPADLERPEPVAATGIRAGAGLVANVSLDAVKLAAGSASRVVRRVHGIGTNAVEQIPRLASLQGMEPETRASLALVLDEQAARDPDRAQFLFEERVHTRAAAKRRFDAVVKGLLDLGVRRGEHVGVLMSTRPSAFAAVAAINRIGAVAVLLRPDGNAAAEAAKGRAVRIIADPEHAADAAATGLPTAVLGGGTGRRRLPRGVRDLEKFDVDAFTLPAWYEPNPGQARDLAFILFTGEGAGLRSNNITNGRWQLSALGTASAAALTSRDTVYCLTPPSHPSGLLVGLGGAVAGGARFAMARQFDPETFWDEVRRYGATVVTYTWTMLQSVVDAPHHRGEDHHPVRLLVGSGMPPALWRQALARFAPARVVEFYTATDAEAVLVNLGAGDKVGSLGRPLPGSARVRIVRWDRDARGPILDERGLAVPCGPGEVGMLLAEADPALVSAGAVRALRGVLKPHDAWVVTGDLVRRDADGDFWLVDPAAAVIDTPDGPRSPTAIRDVLESLSWVTRAVVRAVDDGEGVRRAVAVVEARDRAAADPDDVTAAFGGPDAPAPPDEVRMVDRIPVTAWYRPDVGRSLEGAEDHQPLWSARRRGRRFAAAVE